MGGDIALQDAATSHFHHHEHVQHSEASPDGYQEVSGHDGLRVVADKRPPLLRACSPTASRITIVRPIRPHRSWRNQDPELHRQFRCDAFFAPARVLPYQAHNQLAKIFRDPRSSQPRLPPPKQLEPLALPADEGLRLDNHPCLPPVAQSRPKHQAEPRCGGALAGLNLVFLVKRQRFAQEQHLGTQFRPRRDRQPQKLNALAGCNNKDREQ